MISMSTAKLLFFIALTLGPQSPHVVYVTSVNDSYRWTDEGPNGWMLRTKDAPHGDWVRQDQKPQPGGFDNAEARAITAHDWHDGSFLQLSNGNRVEKQGDAAFYIVDPGAPNQKTYTIRFPQED
jgi:hypothetical protein